MSAKSEEAFVAAERSMVESAEAAMERLGLATEERERLVANAREGASCFARDLRCLQRLRPLKGVLKLDVDGGDAQLERTAPFIENDAVTGAVLVVTQFGPAGIIDLSNAGPELSPEGRRRIVVERLRRSADDVVQYDESRYMALAREMPRAILAELLDRDAPWIAETAGDRVVFRHDVPTSIDRKPEIRYYEGTVTGSFRVTASLETGDLLAFELQRPDGRTVERVTWSDYVGDEAGTLPLVVEHDAWLPGTWESHVHERFAGRQVASRKMASLDILVPEGAVVLDRRVEPSIRYTRRGNLPEDSELASQSADVARKDVLAHGDVVLPGREPPPDEHTVPSSPDPPSRGARAVGILVAAVLFAALAGLLWRLSRRGAPKE